MRRTDPQRPLPTSDAGYGALLETVAWETTRTIEEVHRAVAAIPFGVLRRIPVVAEVARPVQTLHDAITAYTYGAVRHGGRAAVRGLAALAGRAAREGEHPVSGRLDALRPVLNGTHGDFLAASDNPLAFDLAFYQDGRPLSLSPDALRSALPEATDRVAVFLHGLCCDESSWRRAAASGSRPVRPFGERLREDLGYTPLYVRYNSGLPVAENGRELARALQDLTDAYPEPIRELVLVGHSMGGLIAHAACAEGTCEPFSWLERTRMVVALGSPLGGAPLERLGTLASTVLHGFAVTAPLGVLGDARSAGIKDLHQGMPVSCESDGSAPPVAYRFVAASIGERHDGVLSRVIGDGLVPASSAVPEDLSGDTDAVHLGGMSHFDLLSHPRVYRQLRRWLVAAD